MEEVMNGIYRYLSGESNYFKNAFIDQILFPRIYWIVHDRCDTFSLEIKEEKGTIVTKKVECDYWEVNSKENGGHNKKPHKMRLENFGS